MNNKFVTAIGVLLVLGLIYFGLRTGPAKDFLFGDSDDRKPVDTRLGKRQMRMPENDEEAETDFGQVGDVTGGRDVPSELRDLLSLLAAAETGSGQDAELTRSIASQWLAINPKEAVEWAFRLPDGLAQIALMEMARSAESDSLPVLFEMINSAGNERDGKRGFFGLTMTVLAWSEFAPEQAWNAVSDIKDDFTRVSIYSDLVSHLAEDDPALAAEKLVPFVSLYPDGSEQRTMFNPAFGMVAESLARESIQTAVEWVDSLAEGPAKAEAVRGLSNEFSKKDPLGASEWLSGLPEGRSRDMGIMNLISSTRDDDPAVRMAWALSITSDDLRENTVARIGQSWNSDDRDGFRKWLATPQGEALDERLRGIVLDDPGASAD